MAVKESDHALGGGLSDGRAPASRHGTVGWVGTFTLALLCLGCGADPPRLYCGAGVQTPVAELVDEFARQHGVTIQCDYAGSEWLLSRIRLTGQGDLYMPGDVYYVELAEKEGLVTSKKTVCYFVPVILVQKGNPKNIRGLADLARPGISLGLGDPQACAIGRQSSRIFAKNKISERDLDVAVRTVTVSDLNNYVKLGKLDAVIVWDAVAAFSPAETEVVPIPLQQNIISTVAIGVLHSSKHPELAAQFVAFVTSQHGKEVFQKHHYTTTLPP
jgi:molybdate transport system substrate-binding protein